MSQKSRRQFLKTAGCAGAGLVLPSMALGQDGPRRNGLGNGPGNGNGGGKGPGKSGKPANVDPNDPAIIFHSDRCEKCDHCEKSCGNAMGVMTRYDFAKTGKAICLHCGQCTALCPHEAMTERYQYPTVSRLLADSDRVTVALTAPSIRVSLGEAFGGDQGANVEGKMVSALKSLGFDYVFDVTFGADLTIMEEASELLRRIDAKGTPDEIPGPMFTSCCPAWVKLAEYWFPEYLANLSTAKSPILMQGSVVKTYLAQKMNLDPAKLAVVAIAPCTAKKFEVQRPEMNASGRFWSQESIRDIDFSLTNRELARMITEAKIDFGALTESSFDSAMGRGSGAGYLFGNTGGVMEAALRTAYYLRTKENPPVEFLRLESIRGLDAVREAEVMLGDVTLKVAAVHGGANIFALMEKIKAGEVHYDFVEAMACPGGCIGGGGQPKVHGREAFQSVRKNRNAGLYALADSTAKIAASSYENESLTALYADFLTQSDADETNAERLLHTHYQSRAADLG